MKKLTLVLNFLLTALVGASANTKTPAEDAVDNSNDGL